MLSAYLRAVRTVWRELGFGGGALAVACALEYGGDGESVEGVADDDGPRGGGEAG